MSNENAYIKFHHPKGKYDDQLLALALACYAIKETEPEPFLVVIPR